MHSIVRRLLPPRKSSFETRNFDRHSILEVAQVEVDQLDDKDVIIIVMGPTGSGKSTFIGHVTGSDQGVGHGLRSFTSDIRAIRISLSDSFNIVLVDTPGFDDTYKPDLVILKQISDWLQTSYKTKLFLSGLLYFHRISDNRMAGTTLTNLQMFQKLCGSQTYREVVLVTTMWEDVDKEMANKREKELKVEYWKTMLDGGAKVQRLENSRESAQTLLNEVLSNEFQRRGIRIQKELEDFHKKLPDTKAGRQLRGHLEKLVEQQRDLINRMAREVALTKDLQAIASLKKELDELRKMRDEAISQMTELDDSSLMERLRRIWAFSGR